jgi:hypothetical protein
MTTIRLLADVADDPKGAVLSVTQDRAKRLLRTGYAEEVEGGLATLAVIYQVEAKPAKRKGKE